MGAAPRRAQRTTIRVTHVVHYYQPGLSYEENHLSFAQAALGADVTLITSTGLVPEWEAEEREFPRGWGVERGVNVVRLRPRTQARGRRQLVLRGLGDALSRAAPDVLHVHSATGLLTLQALSWARRRRVPVVIDSHLCYFNILPRGLAKTLYYRALFRYLLLPRFRNVIARYVPLMPDAESVLHNELGVPYDRMTHSTLGVDTEAFQHRAEDRAQVRERLGIPPDAPVVAFVGRIGFDKRVDTLVAAWSAVARKHEARLLLAGPASPAVEQAILAAIDPALRGMVSVTGRVANADLPAHLSAADVAVWPGTPGIAMLEAMACGAAIVHTNPYYAAGMEGAPNAEVFPPGDAPALADRLDALLSDADNLAHMRAQSRRLAEQVYDWRVVAARTNALYAEAVSGDPSALPPLWERPTGDGRRFPPPPRRHA